MSFLGNFLDAETLVFKRNLPGPIGRVWDYLTTPALIADWFAECELEPYPGGAIAFWVLVEQEPEKKRSGHVAFGVVQRFEPPHTFSFTWNDVNGSDVVITFKLVEEGEQVRLTMRLEHLVRTYLAPGAAGWHAFLDILAERLRGEAPSSFRELVEEVYPHYEEAADRLPA
jgi:uncharacterized protein YndB with AHSA1/START domain